ncbi:hypothetical protein [Glutamicibacter creatinolyticus]|uniref:hypothetical protein n=1 Tax=Glutamicibacter creatinolyticus TaxID=162496 RepID=UPI0031D14F94
MSSTLEKRKNDKPPRARRTLIIAGLVLIAGLAAWMFVGALGGTNPPIWGGGNGTDGQEAISANEAQDQGPAEPITTFEGAMSGDWPQQAEDSVGCGYVVERLNAINQQVRTEGVEAMREWLEAMSDLQGDPAVAEAGQQFDTVKRTWSTVLGAEADQEAGSEQQLKEAQEALDGLIASIDCN